MMIFLEFQPFHFRPETERQIHHRSSGGSHYVMIVC